MTDETLHLAHTTGDKNRLTISCSCGQYSATYEGKARIGTVVDDFSVHTAGAQYRITFGEAVPRPRHGAKINTYE